ncbi:hypothetical protein ABZZ17_20140 [Streptomyces sp. NPDC006512]
MSGRTVTSVAPAQCDVVTDTPDGITGLLRIGSGKNRVGHHRATA